MYYINCNSRNERFQFLLVNIRYGKNESEERIMKYRRWNGRNESRLTRWKIISIHEGCIKEIKIGVKSFRNVRRIFKSVNCTFQLDVYIIAFGNAILATIYAPAALRFPRTVALLFSINRILAFLNAPTKTRIFLCSAFLRFPLIAVDD